MSQASLKPTALFDERLKETTSRCPECLKPVRAEVWKTGGLQSQVMLRKVCPEHGSFEVCLASDARFYWLAKGNRDGGESCCESGTCCSADGSTGGWLGRNANPGLALGVQEKLSTCLALIEIVHSCNLSCPTCYADSPLGAGARVDAVPLEDLQRRIQGVIDRKGKIEILQLSGGEPTLHPRFFDLLRWLHANPGLDYVLLNTNGVRMAQDADFALELGRTFRYGKFQLYLQFDGVQEEEQRELRGADLRAVRAKCLEQCREMNMPVTLAMTVTPGNLGEVWRAVEFGLQWPNVRGLTFQPRFESGRLPARIDRHPTLTTAEIIVGAVEQSRGTLKYEDFTPLPCGDPNCATIGYLLKVGGRIRSISDFVDLHRMQGFLGTRLRYRLEDLMKCGCESEPLGQLLKQFEMDESHTFRLFIKPFMDRWTWDEDRIDRCCTHVIRPDGKLDSFCRYYAGLSDTI